MAEEQVRSQHFLLNPKAWKSLSETGRSFPQLQEVNDEQKRKG